MKPTFLNREKPLLTNMIQAETPEACTSTAREAIFDGADAFGLQLCQLRPEYRTEKNYQDIFSYMEDRPVYLTNYRNGFSKHCSDEERAEELMLALKAGGTLCDIMGDYFDPSPLELTENPQAIDRQKKLIDQIHFLGGEVLMSSHTLCFLPAEKVLQIAKAHENRGADIVKIVTASNSEEELLENLKICSLLKQELRVPYLFLSVGPYCKIHRIVGPMLGCCMWLCVQRYDALSTKNQPLLRATREVIHHFDYKPDRERENS